MSSVDCDANATYAPEVRTLEALPGFASRLHNPSAMHRRGQSARAVLEEARESVRRFVDAAPRDTILFTSGATESNNTVIQRFGQGKIVTTAIEHPSILAPTAFMQRHGTAVVIVSPSPTGKVDPDHFVAAVDDSTSLVTIMAANNETGVVQPVREICAALRASGSAALLHTDATQLVGKAPLSFQDLGVDMLTLSAHKLGGLTGAGVLVIREGIPISPLVLGGAQEGKHRGGTENVLGIAVLGFVCDLVRSAGPERWERLVSMRNRLETFILDTIPGVAINGSSEDRLPNTISLFIDGVRADDLVVALDLRGVLVSTGAACSSGKTDPSHVLIAMGQTIDRARATIRISLRADFDDEQFEKVSSALVEAVSSMRRKGMQSGSSVRPHVAATERNGVEDRL